MREHEGSTKSAAREAKKLQSLQKELVYRKRERGSQKVSQHSVEVGAAVRLS